MTADKGVIYRQLGHGSLDLFPDLWEFELTAPQHVDHWTVSIQDKRTDPMFRFCLKEAPSSFREYLHLPRLIPILSLTFAGSSIGSKRNMYVQYVYKYAKKYILSSVPCPQALRLQSSLENIFLARTFGYVTVPSLSTKCPAWCAWLSQEKTKWESAGQLSVNKLRIYPPNYKCTHPTICTYFYQIKGKIKIFVS